MTSPRLILPLTAILMFALPSLACDGDDNKSTDHSNCKMHEHKEHSQKNQRGDSANTESNKQNDADSQQDKSEGEHDKSHVH